MKTLITGGNGFSATHMRLLLPAKGVTITDILDTPGGITCDLANFEQTYALIKKTKPARIYHFSGSFSNNYEHDYKCNLLTTKNILDAVLQLKLSTRTLLVGSAAEYGLVKLADNPIKETQPLKPVSVYGLTKTFQTSLMNTYVGLHGMDILMARPFNLLGKNMSPALFIGNLYKQIRQYKAGEVEHITVGNLNNKRDYISITEAVKYFKLIMEKGKSGEIYNVGSGSSVKISSLLKTILAEENISMSVVKSVAHTNKNKLDIKDIRADIQKLRNLLR